MTIRAGTENATKSVIGSGYLPKCRCGNNGPERVMRQRSTTGSWQMRCDECGRRTRWYDTAEQAIQRFAA